VGHALLRVAQEGLANAAKHGTGTVRLCLSGLPTVVRLDIENPMPALPGGPALPGELAAAGGAGPGIGLSSMRERLRAVGGTVRITGAEGQWRIRAEVPVEPGESPEVSEPSEPAA
uniref:ATP-binding protein n=1 Tax=Citricoccus sp. TaxID=1978372 RepID=UPI0037BEA91F